MLTNPIPGPPASVLAAILRVDPDNPPAPGDRHRATFSGTNFPDLPSLMTEVVAMPQYGLLDANVEVTGILVSNGWATQAVTSVTAAYTPLSTDSVVLANANGGAYAVTLPDATQQGFSDGQRYTIINSGTANTVTVNASAGQLIDGGTAVSLTTANAFTSVVFDGANWWIWAASSSGGPPSGSAGGVLSGTYPNPGFAIPATMSGSQASSFILAVTNTHTVPSVPALQVTSAAAGDRALGVEVSGDANHRFASDSTGLLSWGTGSTTRDVQLSRTGTAALTVQPVSAGSAASFTVSATGSAASIFGVTNLGSTPNAPTVQLTATAAADRTFGILVSGDTAQRLRVDSNGRHDWGPGNATVDTNLYRASANTLQTDDSLVIGGNLTFNSITITGTTATGNAIVAQSATTASWAPVSGQYLRAPTVVTLGTTYTTTSATFAAISSGTVSTGSFTAPASGKVVVEADLVMQVSASITYGFALAATTTVTPVLGNIIGGQAASSAPFQPTHLCFPVTGLSGGTAYNLDLMFAVLAADTLSIPALGNTAATLVAGDKGGPITITVKAV